MMNDLLISMSLDMAISRFYNESEESFVYRLCYSALGQWCLSTAQSTSNGCIGTTKHNQTIVVNDLLLRFSELFPYLSNRFVDVNNQQTNFSVFVRRVYEETGYLLTDNENHNKIANFGRSIQVGNTSLFFGLPNTNIKVNGLGVYTNSTDYMVSVNDFLIRDNLTPEEYFHSQFDPIDFYERDIDLDELEFFNPQSNNVPSMSWSKKAEVDCTVARKTEIGPFYRIMNIEGAIKFADEPIEQQNDSFISYEFRRLYFALKRHYNKPLKATIKKLDELHSKIRIYGRLPNREYYLLLLMAWPEKNAFDKVNFIIKTDLIPAIIAALENIGLEINGGQTNE